MIRFGKKSTSLLACLLVAGFLVPPQVFADNGGRTQVPPEIQAELQRQAADYMNTALKQLKTPSVKAQVQSRVAQEQATLSKMAPTDSGYQDLHAQLAADQILLTLGRQNQAATGETVTSLMNGAVSQMGLSPSDAQDFARAVGSNMATHMNGLVPDAGLPAPPSVLQRTGSAATTVAKGVGDPVFIGAIAFQSLATGALHGDLKQSTTDLGQSLISPDFYAGVGMFNLSFGVGGAAVDKLGAKLASTTIGEAVGSKTIPVVGETVGSFARENLVLGMALTVPKFVSVDLNGFTFKDAMHLDFRKLKDAPIVKFAQIWTHDQTGYHWAPGISSTFQDVGITLGSFVVAGAVLRPIMSRIGAQFAKLGLREALEFAGERLAARVAAAGAVEVGALAFPGAGEIVDGVLLVGNLIWAAADIIGFVVAPRAVALGTTMLVANAIEKPVQAANDQRQFDDATTDAVKKLMAVAAQNGGKPDPDALKAAMAGTMAAFRDERDLAYLPAAIDDVTLASRLERVGDGDYEAAMRARDEKLSTDAKANYGDDLFQIARTTSYKRAFEAMTPANASDQQALGIYNDYRTRVAKDVTAIYAAPTLDDSALDPASSSFAISHNRAQLFDEESAVYARVRTILQDPTAQQSMSDNIALLGAVKSVDQNIMKEATGQIPSPKPAAVVPAAPAATTPAQGNPEDGSPDFQPPRKGITDSLKKTNGD